MQSYSLAEVLGLSTKSMSIDKHINACFAKDSLLDLETVWVLI